MTNAEWVALQRSGAHRSIQAGTTQEVEDE